MHDWKCPSCGKLEQNKTYVELHDGSIVELNADNLEAVVASITRKLPEPIRTELANALSERFMRLEQGLGLEGLSGYQDLLAAEKLEHQNLLVAEHFGTLTDSERTRLCILEARIGNGMEV